MASTAPSNPDGSSYNDLTEQFIGDYTGIVNGQTSAYLVWTDARAATPCSAVDAYRKAFVTSYIDNLLTWGDMLFRQLTPHVTVLRHTAASRWLSAGGTEGGLMAVAGWSSRDMLDRYARATASKRAAAEARTLGLGQL